VAAVAVEFEPLSRFLAASGQNTVPELTRVVVRGVGGHERVLGELHGRGGLAGPVVEAGASELTVAVRLEMRGSARWFAVRRVRLYASAAATGSVMAESVVRHALAQPSLAEALAALGPGVAASHQRVVAAVHSCLHLHAPHVLAKVHRLH